MKSFQLAALLLWGTSALFAQQYTVEDDRTVDIQAAEGQSTIVPPGHPQCPAGRILVSTDNPVGVTGTIKYRDLSGDPTTHTSILGALPNPENYSFGTSDHDLVTLPNGDVYYVTGAHTRAPLPNTPPWWNYAWRGKFGPGARSTVLVWMSMNCGRSFHYIPAMEFDTAKAGDGSCAMPQGARLAHHFESPTEHHYLIGGESTSGLSGDNHFRFCDKCRQLYYEDSNQRSACPAGGEHHNGGGVYEVASSDLAGHTNESGLRVCTQCGALYRESETVNACPATHDGTGSPTYFIADGSQPLPLPNSTQGGWRWCDKCQTLIQDSSILPTACPAGGRHNLHSSGSYSLPLKPVANSIGGWTRCHRCNGLFQPGTTPNVCPLGGEHVATGVTYHLPTTPAKYGAQAGWKRCRICGLLFFGGNETSSRCPVPRPHKPGATDYHLPVGDAEFGMQGQWRACTKCGGVFFAAGGIGACTIRGADEIPRYDMGGTDGQLAKADPALNRIILTHQCVGYTQDKSFKEFTLSPNHVNETLIAISNNGAPWKIAATLDTTDWRMGVVPMNQLTLFVGGGLGDWILRGNGSLTGQWTFSTKTVEAAPGKWGWNGIQMGKAPTYDTVIANIHGHAILARTPGSPDVLMAMPDTVGGLHGYRIYFYDTVKNVFNESTPVVPKKSGDVDFHLQAIDLGGGKPVLLYWYDFDSSDPHAITIRGRFILGAGKSLGDFAISSTNHTERSFPATQAISYGDYQTAGGYVKANSVFVYHPMWVEPPDGQVHFGTVVLDTALKPGQSLNLGMVPIKMAPAVPLSKVRVTREAEQEQREHLRTRQH